jgi:hypothetical protein
MKYFAGGAAIVVLIVIGLLIVDVTVTPPAVPPGRCVFQDNFILPDRCLSSCSSGVDCPTTRTRPYFVFWTEAAGCPDAVICGRRSERPLAARPDDVVME